MLFPGGDVAQAQFMRRRFCITCLERGRRMECMKLSRWMLARLPLPIREIERPNSHFNGLGALRPSGGANAVAGCWPDLLRYAKTVYKKTARGRARDAKQQLHNARRPAAPQR